MNILFEYLPPRLIVRSGREGHYHVYWTYREPVDPEVSRALWKRVRKYYLDTDPSEYPSKTMRLPFSANWKHNEPVLIEPSYQNPAALITPEQVTAALDALGVPQLTDADRHRRRGRTAYGDAGASGPIQIAPPEPVDMDHAQAVWNRLPPWARMLAATGWQAGGRYLSRSEADAAVIRALIDAGATDDEIKHVFYYLPQGIGAKYRYESGDRYLAHSIDALRISVDDVAAHIYKVEGGYYAKVYFRILEGEHEGREDWTYLAPNKTYFEYVYHSARLPVPWEWTRYTAQALEGAEVTVRLHESTDGSVSISRWIYGQDVKDP